MRIRNARPRLPRQAAAAGLLAVSIAAPGQAWSLTPAEDSLVRAERAFASTSLAKGMRTAFLTYLADDGIVFHPHPVNGKDSWKERPEPQGSLAWQPIHVEVSKAGDLGLSTGPWEYREGGPDGKPVAWGNFVSVWKKAPHGDWKVAIDHGIENPSPPTRVGTEMPVSGGASPTPTGDSAENSRHGMDGGSDADEKAKLFAADEAFSKLSALKGASTAYDTYAADDIRLYRKDALPALGKKAARKAVGDRHGSLKWSPFVAVVSESGDFGYTYGSSEFRAGAVRDPAEAGSYLKVWRRRPDGSWSVVADVIVPDPMPRKESIE